MDSGSVPASSCPMKHWLFVWRGLRISELITVSRSQLVTIVSDCWSLLPHVEIDCRECALFHLKHCLKRVISFKNRSVLHKQFYAWDGTQDRLHTRSNISECNFPVCTDISRNLELWISIMIQKIWFGIVGCYRQNGMPWTKRGIKMCCRQFHNARTSKNNISIFLQRYHWERLQTNSSVTGQIKNTVIRAYRKYWTPQSQALRRSNCIVQLHLLQQIDITTWVNLVGGLDILHMHISIY